METTASGQGRAPATPSDAALLSPTVWRPREAAHAVRADLVDGARPEAS